MESPRRLRLPLTLTTAALTLALPYPKINLLESFGPASGLLLTFAGLAVAMLLVHLNARRFQPKRSPAREPGQTESLA